MKSFLIILLFFSAINLTFSQNIDTLYTNCYVKFSAEDPKKVEKDNNNVVLYFMAQKSIVSIYIDKHLIKKDIDVGNTWHEPQVKLVYNLGKKWNKPHSITILEKDTNKCMQFYTDSRYSCYYIVKIGENEKYIAQPYWTLDFGTCFLEFE